MPMNSLHVQILGAGPPLVLIHGWAMHSGIWRGFAQNLAEQYQVICVDLPGHGQSPKLPDFTLEAVSEAVASAVTQPVCHWLGWSLGGLIVLEIARRYPERVDGIILLAANPHFTRTDTWPGIVPSVLTGFAQSLTKDCRATLLRFLSLQINQDALEHRQLLRELKLAVQAHPVPEPDTLQGGLEILQTADLRQVLASVGCPVLVILGEKDTLVPIATAAHLQQLSPTVHIEVLNRAGHVPFLSHAEPVVAAIDSFINRS